MSTAPTASINNLKPGNHLYLIDGSGYIFRAYHALPPLTRKSDGLPVGAVQGFCNMLWKLLKETRLGEKPTHLAVIFDASSKTFRNDIYPQYKANRSEPPADLRPQFGLIRQATQAFNVAAVEQENYEADDLIATYARLALEAGATCRIVSSDKDLMQLVKPGVTLYDTMKDKDLSRDAVIEKFGVPPEQVIDVQALAGDSIDNVPGIPGIGLKTGAQLITEYGNLETLLAQASEIKQQKRRENLIQYADQARISKRLVTLDEYVPLNVDIASFAVEAPRPSRLIGFLKALEFTSFTKKIATELDADASAVEPLSLEVKFWPPIEALDQEILPAQNPANFEKNTLKNQNTLGNPSAKPFSAASARALPTPAEIIAALTKAENQPTDYLTLPPTPEAVNQLLADIADHMQVAIKCATTTIDTMQAELVGISFATQKGRAYYVPFHHKTPNTGLFTEAVAGQVEAGDFLEKIKPLLESHKILKISHDSKFDYEVLARHGISLNACDDIQLIAYGFEAGILSPSLAALAERHLGHKLTSLKEISGTGRTSLRFDQLTLASATAYAGEICDCILQLWHILKFKLLKAGKTSVYETLDRPLIPILGDMEMRGVLVDVPLLRKLSHEFSVTNQKTEQEIFHLAGESFNIASPKQLGDILFGKLGIAGGRKTPTGAWSTDVDVLEELATQGVALAKHVIDWRQTAKLMTTYTDALPTYINPQTHRVHTSYMMAATSTGRLSSTEPNLQNIPIRTEQGRKIRAAFIAEQGTLLVSADYSQIELRVLAHVADIPQLRQAFARGEDIHALTASEMFGHPVAGMDPAIRRRAKAINFGIIYGISAFGLANQLSISREEAANYIKTYFLRFPGIRDYMEAMKKQIRDDGFVETIFGRRAYFPKIKSSNAAERANAERASINAPIQGSAADIIKRAMIHMPAALTANNLKARMLLQVHDELIFEVPEAEVEATLPLIQKTMSEAPQPVIHLTVPLQVDVRAAKNWDEAH